MQPYRARLKLDILHIAERIVATEGLAALQARRVAGEANCAVGTIYNIFDDIDGLVIAVNEQTLNLLTDPLMRSVEATAGRPTSERLTSLALAYMGFALENQMRWRAVFEHRLPPEREVGEQYRDNRARLLALIEQEIAREIPETQTRAHAARALFAAVHGIIALALDNKMSPFDAATVEAEIRFIVKAAARGLAEAG